MRIGSLLLACGEARVSVISQTVSLEEVVAKSSVIFVARSLKPSDGSHGWQVEAHERLKSEVPVSGSRVMLRAANSDLYAAIGKSLSKNEPNRMPILDSYHGSIGSAESLEREAGVLKLIRSSKK